jgi:hypothetical protein
MPEDDVERRLTSVEERLTGVEEAMVRVERAVVGREAQIDPLNALAEHVERVVGAFDDWRAEAQTQPEARDLSSFVEDMGRQADQFLAAISRHTHTTNELLLVADARLHQIEDKLADSGSNFEADPAIVDEGKFLSAQLAGVTGTEDPHPLFKDAPDTRGGASGLDVLAAAINKPRKPTKP